MSQVVPLIRAAALMPMLRWLRENGRSVEEVLTAAGQSYLLTADPMTPVPLLGGVAILSLLEQREGADIGVRMATEASVLELAIVSRGVLGARTPREAFGRVALVMPCHCTHEVFAMQTDEGHVIVRDTLSVLLDRRTRHVAEQYILGILREVCAATGAAGPLFSCIEMTAHPDLGFRHLTPWFGDAFVPTRGQTLAAWIPEAIADRPYRKAARTRFDAASAPVVAPLRGDGSLSHSIRILLPRLLEEGGPSLDQLVGLSGMSRRTLQRRLSEEGTSFSALFAELRQAEAVRRLSNGGSMVGEVSRQLGFSQQSALTRAMRRWTGEVPSRLRSRGT